MPPGDSSSEESGSPLKREEEAREKRIVSNSHSWRLVKEKVEKEVRVGKKIGTLSNKVY